MGFIKINENELKTKNYSNLIGNPFKIFERDNEGTKLEATHEQTHQQIYDISEILIRKEEILEYQYNYDGKRKAAKGYGNFVIYNNSNKDRIWDAQLKFIKTQNNNISSKDKINLGIFEPNSNKNIKYAVTASITNPNPCLSRIIQLPALGIRFNNCGNAVKST